MRKRSHQRSPALVIIGGFAGTGKTTISKRLSAELSIPRLGRTIKNSAGTKSGDAYRIAYDVLFRLGEDLIQSGVSAILDLTMGWEFQWQHVDSIIHRYPKMVFIPIILRCPHATCIERTQQRHRANPEHYDPPEIYETEPKNRSIWKFLARLDRSDIHWVDVDRSYDKVYEEVREYISTQLDWT